MSYRAPCNGFVTRSAVTTSPQLIDALDLPVGLVVLSDDLKRVLHLNPLAERLWDQASRAEFGSRDATLAAFRETCEAEAGKKRWFSRVLAPAGGDVMTLEVLRAGQRSWGGESCHVFVIVPDKEWPRGDGELGTFVWGAFRLDVACKTVMYRRDYVPVTDIEFKLLAHLCRHPDRVLSKADLLKSVWLVRSTATRVLDVTLNRLRKKLLAAGFPAEALKTLHGHGYAFMPGRLVT